MEEVYEKPVIKNSHKKRNIAILMIVILFVFLISYGQISSIFLTKDLNQTECQEKLSLWCTDCFSRNNGYTNIWETSGTNVGVALAKCSKQYLQIDWTPEQNCTGNSIDYCINYIKE